MSKARGSVAPIERRMAAKAVAKQTETQSEAERVSVSVSVSEREGGCVGVLKESGLVAGKDNNFINKYLCALQSCLRSFAFRF